MNSYCFVWCKNRQKEFTSDSSDGFVGDLKVL